MQNYEKDQKGYSTSADVLEKLAPDYPIVAYVLEYRYGMKWWDYTGYFLNINGRICAEGLLVFGIAGMAAVYFIAPHLDNAFVKIKEKRQVDINGNIQKVQRLCSHKIPWTVRDPLKKGEDIV